MQLSVAVKQLDLKAARDAKGWKMPELARRSGINKATISRIEAGEIVNPSYETVVALEKALKVPRGTLVFGHVMARTA
jgi:transcriptional regulator with XRE-family HTH domain